MGDPRAPLVGRDAERSLIIDALHRCRRGQSTVTMLLGEAGVGKTRLLEEAAVLAGQQQVRRMYGTFSQSEQDMPLAALRRGLSWLPQPEEAAARLEALFRATDRRDVRYQMVESAMDAVMDVIDRWQPVVFLLEDVHWADSESLQVMRAVARRSVGMGVAVLLTARPTPRPAGLTRFLQLPVLEVHRVEVPPLASEALMQLTTEVTGAVPGARLRAQLHRTGGNSLLATELLAEIRRSGALVVEDGVAEVAAGATLRAPDLAAHVRGRVDAMSAGARQVVTLVALSDLTSLQVARLLGSTVAAASAAIDEACTDGLIVARGNHLSLHHDLLRDVVLDLLPDAVRAGLHADLSRMLVEEGADLMRIAPHLVSGSLPGPDDLTAVAEAGRQLVGSAPSVAAALLRRAWDGGVADAAVDLTFALILLGDLAGANAVLDSIGAAPGSHQARARLAFAQLDFLRGDMRAAAGRFEEVAGQLPPGPRKQLAVSAAAIASLFRTHLDVAQAQALRACAPSPDVDVRAGRSTGLLVRAWVAALRGDLRRADALARSGHRLATEAPAAQVDANHPDFFLGCVALWAEQPGAAGAAVTRGLRRCEEHGMGWARPSLHAIQADIEIRAGRWDDADAHIDAALSFADDMEVELGVPLCLAQRARLTIGRGGDPTAVLQAAEQSVGRLGGQGADLVLWMRGLNHLTAGRHGEATQVLGFLWGRLEVLGVTLRQVHIASDLMRAAIVADPERAAAVVSWLEEVAARRPWPRATAVLTHARGMQAGDQALMRQAAAMLEELDDGLEAARMYADAGLAAPGPAGARDRTQAAAVLEHAGAWAWLAPLQTAAPAGPPTPRHRDDWDLLTEAQARIVHLVGQGLSNQAIAERLSISRRTVESHLYHSYAKLGIASRVELGVAAARRTTQGWTVGPGAGADPP
ncbi:LuxR family transcriptional regulator [soil metagenome]